MRNFMEGLRNSGIETGGPAALSAGDRQSFANQLDRLLARGESAHFNLGNGQGFSVSEVIETARQVTGREIAVRYEPRRAGDPPRLVADSRLAQAVLGWTPQRADLATIIADAWVWEQKWPWGQ